jgi:predicted MFS family arabinose efflux permease
MGENMDRPDATLRPEISRTQSNLAIAALALSFGMVGTDRFMMTTLFPVIAKDLELGYDAIGIISGALAFAWGGAALLLGNLSDHIGRRPVLLWAMIVFSTVIGLSGLATGLMTLVLVRIVMGLADGAFTPASIAATMELAPRKHRGLAVGLQQMTSPLVGLGFAPLLIAALLPVLDWRWIFPLFALPGFILATILWKLLPRPVSGRATRFAPGNLLADVRTLLGFRNIWALMVLMLAWLTCMIGLSTFLPSYLTDYLALPFETMSRIMSAFGFGGAVGMMILPALSDWLGRKKVVLLGILGAAAAIYALPYAGADPSALFACLFVAMMCVFGLTTLTVGPISEESVPPGLAASATGLVIAAGEFFGGGIAPMLLGRIATAFGIEHIHWLPLGALALAFVFALLLQDGHRPAATPSGPEQAEAV